MSIAADQDESLRHRDGTREVVQIAASGACVYALCDDGSMWVALGVADAPDWTRLPPIPTAESVS
jgi:hypothetical protein